MIRRTDGSRAKVVSIRVRSDPGRVPAAVERAMDALELSDCVRGHEVEVELALREALTNAIVHGNRMDPDKWVHVWARCEPGNGASIVVKDEGSGFDPRGVPDPTTGAAVFSEHGRGVFMMKAFMDEVSYEQGGTVVHLRKGPVRRVREVEPLTQPLLVINEAMRSYAEVPQLV